MNKISWCRIEPAGLFDGATLTIFRKPEKSERWSAPSSHEYEFHEGNWDRFEQIIDLMDGWDVWPVYNKKCKIECIEYYRRE